MVNPSVVELTSELIRCHPIYRSLGVFDALDIAELQLKRLGLDCDVRPRGRGRQITATHAFAQDGPHVIVNGHIDIESVADEAGWSVPGLWRSGNLREGRIHGAGANDMLGGVAVTIATLHELVRREELTGRITVQFVVGRHLGGAGTADLLADLDLPGVDLAVLTEPTDRHVCTAAYGSVQYRLSSTGTAGAMAGATDRENAATHAAMALLALNTANSRLQEIYPTRQGIRYILPGMIHAGEEAAVPATEAQVDFAMALPPLLPEEVALEVVRQSLLDRFAASDTPLPVWERYGPHFPPTDLGHSAFAALVRNVNPALRWCQYPCPSDARVFQDAGIPVVLYGPGDHSRTRRPNEYVETGELYESVTTLSTALSRWLSEGSES
ncbi:M20 family metallopeptidase [Streptosporangium sp. NPDC087985]|uniref:M20 family metallopeptidase n=1 Tax=Streptosporangium sp. NPDC087985 TaxID=3366196 RepID=UPI0037FC0985